MIKKVFKDKKKPINYKISKVICCYTCVKSQHGEDILGCDINYDYAEWTKDKKIHFGISPIGICDEYKQRKNIKLSSKVLLCDNIMYPANK